MKYLFLFILPFTFLSCDNQNQSQNKENEAKNDGSYGIPLSNRETQDAFLLADLLENKNSAGIKLTGKIESVCQMSGCWIDMEIGNGKVVHITFNEEAFVLPMDISGKTATVEGFATKEIIPLEYLKRQAKSEGKTQEEIDAITEPEVEYSFVASGVKIEE